MMQLNINGIPRTIPDDDAPTIAELLQRENVPSPEMVAVRINGTIVRRNAYDSTTINDGDRVDFLSFMGGG